MKKKNNTYKNYIDYLKDNPKGYWFRRKLYGFGWVPATWEGWLTILIFVVGLVYSVQKAVRGNVDYWIIIAILVILLMIVGYLKGEKPKWQWGLKN